MKMGQTNMHNYMKPLLERIEKGQIDPGSIIPHCITLDEASEMYKASFPITLLSHPNTTIETLRASHKNQAIHGAIMSVETMQELLIDELKDLYSAEKQIVRALPKLARASSSQELQQALLQHLEETRGQVARLEQISGIVGKKLTGKSCVGMKGVLHEGAEVLEDTEKGDVRDAALIAASQRVEHYEMAGYGSARDFAKQLGLSDVAQLLDETLAEEKAADKLLTGIAKSINRSAIHAS